MAPSNRVASPTSVNRIRRAVDDRDSTDYIFHFWTALGWTVLTFGLYWFYVFYQLIRRSRDHNRRVAMLLSAAEDFAIERAGERAGAETLIPALTQVQSDIQDLRKMDSELREPFLWLLVSLVGSGLVWLAAALLLDQDLLRHERSERSAEACLTTAFSSLGMALPTPPAATKEPHNFVARIVAVVLTAGLYSLWWVADLMREGNASFRQTHAWEDALLASLTDVGRQAA